MQLLTEYEDVTQSVLFSLSQKVIKLRLMGVNDLIIDPGFGFGKTLEQNYELLKNLAVFKPLKCPILVGLSRKSMVNKVLNIKADQALNGSTVLHTLALINGANLLRVHDVKEAKEVAELVSFYYNI
jgi:dihydropteroate synthase